jgi:hypothetical protein
VTLTGISVNSSSRQVAVSVAADLSSLIPALLPFHGVNVVTGNAEAKIGEKYLSASRSFEITAFKQ